MGFGIRFGVTPQKENALWERYQRLGLREQDIEEKFVRGSGRGGQKINKTSSAVYLKHRPSGIEVKCQKERSQALNRFFARRLLVEQLEQQSDGTQSAAAKKRAKLRKQKARRRKRAVGKTGDE